MHVRTVCVEAEQKNAKQNDWTWLDGLLAKEYQNFLEGGKLVGGASVACVVSHCYPIFTTAGSSKYFHVYTFS